MSQEIFNRNKTHLNVCTIGHVDHGKSTLTSAILKVQASKGMAEYTENTIGGSPLYDDNSNLLALSYVEYETYNRHYAHVDCPGHADYVKNMVSSAVQTDAAILVVSAADGPMPQTEEHVMLAKRMGIENIIVFMNKTDTLEDEEFIFFIQMQVRELLSYYGYNGDDIPFIKGSGLQAINGDEAGTEAIEELLNTLDSAVPDPVRDTNGPFFMAIEDVFSVQNLGTVVTGRVASGTVNVNDMVDVLGLNNDLGQRKVTKVEMFKKIVNDGGQAGDNIGLVLENTYKGEVERGHVMGQPGSISAHTQFNAEVYMFTSGEGGLYGPVSDGFSSQYFFHTIDITGNMSFSQGTEIVMPGDNAFLKITLQQSVVMETGTKFAIRKGGKTIGTGTVTGIIS